MNRIFLAFLLSPLMLIAQDCWKQKVDYRMDIQVNAEKYQYKGKMDLTYGNHSSDVLDKVYFHLYYNAFQPGSLMDGRLQNIQDPDGRMVEKREVDSSVQVVSKISVLSDEEKGYQKIHSIKQNGKKLDFRVYGTILEVTLAEPLAPGKSTQFQLDWEAQVPNIIRRGGRNNQEGIAFSMSQWYPKMAMYDEAGWHLDEYIGREFYAPFGNFDVKITLPSSYIVGASGQLQNESKMQGYSSAKPKKKNTTWHFKAHDIHDFVWSADTTYQVDKQEIANGPTVYYLYSKNLEQEYKDRWKEAQKYMPGYYEFMAESFGKYPWETYTIMQAGDGGMEYGTATFITGKRSLESLVGVIFHEASHSWFQQLYGIDETQDEWFDEGFTSYAEAKAMEKVVSGKDPYGINVHNSAYQGYFNYVKSGLEEPLSILADYYNVNYAYGVSAYYKGQVYPTQLGYIIGEEALKETFKKFYEQWKFNHPSYEDFGKVAEQVSGINIKWYENLFVNTTRTINYGVKEVNGKTVTLENLSNFPMPLDVLVTYENGEKELFYIPLNAMRGAKKPYDKYYEGVKITQLPDWGWTFPTYQFKANGEIKSLVIDYTHRLADIDYSNNVYNR